jgi:PKD repeat protein
MKKITKNSIKFLFIACTMLLTAISAKGQCTANFNFTVSNGNVSFFNTSTGTFSTTTYNWNFGDGTTLYIPMNNTGNTAHTYSSNGVYSVTLVVNDTISSSCNSSVTLTLAITSATCLGNASFIYNIKPNGVVDFFNMSSGSGLTYTWGFGDSNTSTTASPTHTYLTSGLYNVTLTATSFSGVCTFSTVQSIYVNVAPCNLAASFTYAVTNNTVNFTNTSAGTNTSTSYYWYFGDGGSSTSQNPTHVYAGNGTYYVSLMLTDNQGFICQDSTGLVVNITNGPCLSNANFSLSKDSLTPLTWNIFPSFTGTVTGILWNWGDGSTSTSMYPSHTFSAAGTYSICVTITNTCPTGTATSSYCANSSIYKMNGGNSMIEVRVIDPANPLEITEKLNDAVLVDIYPNPNNGEASVYLNRTEKSGDIRITVYDVTGKSIANFELNEPGSANKIDLNNLPDGTYHFQISNGDLLINKKVIIIR